MPDQLLNLLKLFLLLLLYLFFLRVLRAVWAEVNPPKVGRGAGQAEARAGAPARRRQPQARRRSCSGSSPRAELKGRSLPARRRAHASAGPPAARSPSTTPTPPSCTPASSGATGQVYVEDLGPPTAPTSTAARSPGRCVVQRGDKLQIGNTVLELGS